MRFSAIMNDIRSVEDFTRAAQAARTFGQADRCIIRLAPDHISFVVATGLRDGYFTEFKFSERELFSEYHFKGYSETVNYIVFEVQLDSLLTVLNTRDDRVKVKLTGSGAANSMIIRLLSIGLNTEIPVVIVPSQNIADFVSPVLRKITCGLIVSPIRDFQKHVECFQKLEYTAMMIRLFPTGQLCLMCESEFWERAIDLDGYSLTNDTMEPAPTDIMRLDIGVIRQFLACIPPTVNRLTIRISDNAQCLISIRCGAVNYFLYLANMQPEPI